MNQEKFELDSFRLFSIVFPFFVQEAERLMNYFENI